MRHLFFCVFVLLTLSAALARQSDNFNSGWRFARYGLQPDGTTHPEPTDLSAPALNDTSWRQLNLPHDWGIEGPFRDELNGEQGKLPWAGIGWYRKHFKLPAGPAGQRVFLEIDGAMSNSEVFINGQSAGGWPYGYASYRVDLTPYLVSGDKENVVAIRLNNPPESSRWYPGGGLYRNVRLLTVAPVHAEPDSIFVRTPEISAAQASVLVDSTIANTSATSVRAVIRHEIMRNDAPAKVLAHAEVKSADIAAGASGSVQAQLSLPSPALWDINSPTLHLLRTSVVVDGVVTDTVETSFGVRTAEFRSDGFYLNGRRMPIQGVCEHHDLGPLGAAINTTAIARKLDVLRSFGCNAIRTSHNPPAPEFLELCDRKGFLVMDELFDGWKLTKTPADYGTIFDTWHERDARAFIRRDRNHPSVVLWSSGNEIMEQLEPDGVALAHRLRDIIRSEDPTRPVSGGLNKPISVQNGFHKGFDVIGINYRSFMFAGNRALAPGKPMIESESASTVSSRGEYVFPVNEDRMSGLHPFQVSSYDLYHPRWAHTPDYEWRKLDENPFVAGEFVWTGFDYIGEPTPYNQEDVATLHFDGDDSKALYKTELAKRGGFIPSRSSYFGIVDLCGFPKDRYYLYQSRWRADLPMAHILPHWTWPGREGHLTPIHVYTSGDEAELFVNGRSMGRKKKRELEYRLRWDDVIYQPGEVKVVAYKNGKPWAESAQRTAGAPAKLVLTAEHISLRASSDDLAYLAVRVEDAKGVFTPTANSAIRFTVKGPGEVIAVCNGDAASFEPFQASAIKAFNGLAQVIVRAKPGATGELTITAESEGLTASSTTIAVTR